MEKIQLKTNIKCSGCVATVTPFLNEAVGTGNWKVDIENPNKTLTVTADHIQTTEVIKAVQDAGFKAENLS